MRRSELWFERPPELAATAPAETRGQQRDEARLLVSTATGHHHTHFYDLPLLLQPGDLLVVNRSATLPASLPATGSVGEFTLNLSTYYGRGLWLAEPRWSPALPGPLPLQANECFSSAGLSARLVAPYPGIPYLWFVQFEGDVQAAMYRYGQPIRYGYVQERYPLNHYQTIFADVPGSAEMPSAGYPFTARVLEGLQEGGVQIADIVLHTGVSSLEVETDEVEAHPLYPEPFGVPARTASAVNAARDEGRRVIAVGTTVVRALESAWDGRRVVEASGFTRVYIHPRRGIHTVDGLITGLHDPVTSHLAMLYAIAGQDLIRAGYSEAVRERYRWHEFGDSHLILPGEAGVRRLEDRFETVRVA
ncbi:MAG: S-adenosylmethionine:tRNA ribosyltransferase-isomerase [Chloroflexi bacterium]|nr:S-adenosylmethionine:tRNA ribosyltransferase-isomerase [Chloroflexota bacterium]